MEVSPYRLSQQEAALKSPTADAGLDKLVADTLAAVNGGIDKIKADNTRLRTKLESLADSVDAYFDEMGIAPDDTPLSKEVQEARKAL